MGNPPSKFDQFAQYVADPDRTVAVTDYELRQLAARLPEDDALPVSTRGEVFVLMPGTHTLEPLIQLCRMRDARTGPHYPEGVDGAQGTAQAPEEATTDQQLTQLADDMQERVEAFLSNLGVDPHKYDHQNHAGDLVGSLFAILRRHALLPQPHTEAILDRPVTRSLRQAARDGYLTQRDVVEMAVLRALRGAGQATADVMKQLDEVLGQ